MGRKEQEIIDICHTIQRLHFKSLSAVYHFLGRLSVMAENNDNIIYANELVHLYNKDYGNGSKIFPHTIKVLPLYYLTIDDIASSNIFKAAREASQTSTEYYISFNKFRSDSVYG